MNYQIFTDGSCDNNPLKRQGAYYYVILDDQFQLLSEGGSFSENTSNSREEMKGILYGLQSFEHLSEKDTITIYSDSQFIVNSIAKGWLDNWVTYNYLDDKKNPDLWMFIYPLIKKLNPVVKHIKGHQKNNEDPFIYWNNYCDINAGKIRKENIS